jgi:integrase
VWDADSERGQKVWTKALSAESHIGKKIMKRLTASALDGLVKKTGRHGDGQGLFFRVIGKGRAYFCYRYRFKGREREVSIGPYNECSLAEARKKHAELRKLVVVDKIDPLAEKQAVKEADKPKTGVPTFGEMADRHLKANEGKWRSARHRQQWRNTVRDYCALIRDLPVDQIDTQAVLKVLEPIWDKTPETASRLRGRIEAVLAAAQVDGHIEESRSNPARWKNWLNKKLPDPRKLIAGRRGHYPAMPYEEVPAFFSKLKAVEGTAAKALMLAVLTAKRSSEVLEATWYEFDLDKALWIIPKERMKKADSDHREPLTAAALDILKPLHAAKGKNPHVFAGTLARRPINELSLLRTMAKLDAHPYTPHGFRSSFRDWAGDKTNFQREVIEAVLAHAVGNQTEAAYRRSDALEKRRDLMQSWANYLSEESSAKVESIEEGRKRHRKATP